MNSDYVLASWSSSYNDKYTN